MSYPYCSALSSGLHITARFPGGWNGAGGMVHYSNLALHRQAADWYVRRYYTEHGDWLRGEHSFTVTFGKGDGFNVRTPIGDSYRKKTGQHDLQGFPSRGSRRSHAIKSQWPSLRHPNLR